MWVAALLFFFTAVCNPDDPYACASENYVSDLRWPGGGAYTDYDAVGPYLSLEDCQAARRLVPYQYVGEDEGARKMYPWSDQGESLCWAREVRVRIE